MTDNLKKKPNISLFFPVYNDENTVERVTEKSLQVLRQIADEFEIIIIDDGSPDKSGEIADRLAQKYDFVKAIHHETNRGYGAAVKTGLKNCRYEIICFTDGDDEYDVFDFIKLIKLIDHYELIITFRYKKMYSSYRQFVSWVYNKVLRVLFRSPYRDISTGLRLIKKHIASELDLLSDSPFIGAEITIKTMLKGHPVGEVGIQTSPRKFGKGAATSFNNIITTIKDMIKVRKMIFSTDYEKPPTNLS
jgi:glycosyltransferase involved in cell wall biosynthesis